MPSRFDVAASGGVGPCFGEPPLPALPLPGGDDELFNPHGIEDLSPTCDNMQSPTFGKPMLRDYEKTIEGTRFVAQHMRNKDKFEGVSTCSCYKAFFLFVYSPLIESSFHLQIPPFFCCIFFANPSGPLRRWKKIGNTLPWYLIVCSYGYLRWLVSLVRWRLSARRRASTTQRNQSTSFIRRSPKRS